MVVALTARHFSLGFGVFVLYTDTLLCLLINSLFGYCIQHGVLWPRLESSYTCNGVLRVRGICDDNHKTTSVDKIHHHHITDSTGFDDKCRKNYRESAKTIRFNWISVQSIALPPQNLNNILFSSSSEPVPARFGRQAKDARKQKTKSNCIQKEEEQTESWKEKKNG